MRQDIEALRARLRAANPVPPCFDHLHADDLLRRLTSSTDAVIGDDSEEPVEPVKPYAALLTLDQAAAYLNITDEQVAAFIADGTLDYINIGRGTKRPRYRFTKQDLDAFIERRRQREAPCLSTSTRSPRSTTTPSKSVVVGFTARRDAQLARKPKPSKP